MRFYISLLLVLFLSFPAFGEDMETRIKALEDTLNSQEKTLSEQMNGARTGNLRLIDISMDVLFAAGGSTEDDEELESLQGGGHDPRKRGFTAQNIELSLGGAIDPYLKGESHIILFLDPLTGETRLELEEVFMTTQSLPYGLQIEARSSTSLRRQGLKAWWFPTRWVVRMG